MGVKSQPHNAFRIRDPAQPYLSASLRVRQAHGRSPEPRGDNPISILRFGSDPFPMCPHFPGLEWGDQVSGAACNTGVFETKMISLKRDEG
ncbi:hypothetical protein BaRGS_00006915 [Batillaria attramentaria]|uniref:PARP catalytic domain-containing protein n=1 Tax=Batillaria attramentaria TaxID=370345 RepID=A0ABD0LQ67_9CAEN